MATVTTAEAEILSSLDELSPIARREAIRRLLPSAGWLEREVERKRSRIEALARKRNLEWCRLTEAERECLIDDLLHE